MSDGMSDTEAARKYSTVNGFILPNKYGDFLNGRLSLRQEVAEIQSQLAAAEQELAKTRSLGITLKRMHDEIVAADRAERDRLRAENEKLTKALEGIAAREESYGRDASTIRQALADAGRGRDEG